MTERRARRRPGENRKRLLEAGLIEFGLFGFSAASTSGIAARAEIPQPHLYASFTTKQELFLACVERLEEELSESQPAAHSATPRDVLLRFLYQAVAAAHDPGMHDALLPRLSLLRASLGESRFEALVAAGARALIDAQR
ncbi:TetR/AcrR family transcriptional regulator [Leucobacter sp.]